MRRDIVVKSKSLGGSSDLTLLATIRPGFVDSLESVTYKTRVKRVLETLHGARLASHEQHTARLLSDSVERVGVIHSVRVAVIEPEDKVLLVVTFDGNWQSYIRVLWEKVGTLLDLIFFGTVDYVTAHGNTFEAWCEWARRVQVETGFFYGPSEATARDALCYRRVERMRRRGEPVPLNPGDEVERLELSELRAVLPSAEEAVRRLMANRPGDLLPDDPQIPHVTEPRMVHERVRNGLRGLAALYRLTDLHRPTTPDGDVLHRAAVDLLLEFVDVHKYGLAPTQLKDAEVRFERQLKWLFPGEPASTRPVPPEPAGDPIPQEVLNDVQGGVLRPYVGVTHGVALMLVFDQPAAARFFIPWLRDRITSGSDSHDASGGQVFYNAALTPAGLLACGLSEDELAAFPEEFRQGMAVRAGLLGDVRNNHPSRWRLPRRFDGLTAAAPPAQAVEVEIDGVHAVLMLRCAAQDAAAAATHDVFESQHPLRGAITALQTDLPEVKILALQSLKRYYRPGEPTRIQEHFGYADGNGQPEIEPSTTPGVRPFERNRAHLGEVVLGHDNAADFADAGAASGCPYASAARQRLRWTKNSSFLVARKYRQYVHRLERVVKRAANHMAPHVNGTQAELEDLAYAKLMGRCRDGKPLAPHRAGTLNNFLYENDPRGEKCPLDAHIRLSNPRFPRGAMVRPPRLMRRSMSYGPPHQVGKDDDADDRGLLFMAYVTSISEQFEVVQRWLTNGNATGVSSLRSCPIVGVPENGLPRHFAFETEDKKGDAHVVRMALEPTSPPLFEEPSVLTRLEWGMYTFAPSLSAWDHLWTKAIIASEQAPASPPAWQALRGRQLIAGLQQCEAEQDGPAALEAWKAALEDPEAIDRLDSAAIWAAIREDHGGVLKTPYGVLVASRDLLAEVLMDRHRRYSIAGQFERMKSSIGEIFLGLDAGPRYDREASEVNLAIGALTRTPQQEAEVYQIAFAAAEKKIDAIVKEARRHSNDVREPRFEVGFEAREVMDEVLADLCEAWFGIQDSPYLKRSGSDLAWTKGPPLYPGHFTALSRYMFQPNPGPASAELAERYGRSLRQAMRKFVADHHRAKTVPTRRDGSEAPVAAVIFRHRTHGRKTDWVARTMVGVLMGFIAPITGAVFNVLREWVREGTFGALRAELDGRAGYDDAVDVLQPAMEAAALMRPMPQIVWRTAVAAHRLGAPDRHVVDVAQGEKVVLALVSGTQQSLADGEPDGRLMFGGIRRPAGEPHPTHACPGSTAGIAAMLGALAALLVRTERLRPGVGPLTFVAEGNAPTSGGTTVPPPGAALKDIDCSEGEMMDDTELSDTPPPAGLVAEAEPPMPTLPRRRKNTEGMVFVWGDSWVDYEYDLSDLGIDLGINIGIIKGKDMRDWLVDFGYEAPSDFCEWKKWKLAKLMGAKGASAPFCKFVRDHVQAPANDMRAILVSAGGNDCTEGELKAMLKDFTGSQPSASKPEELFVTSELDMRLDLLEKHYRVMVAEIREMLTDKDVNVELPILIHGYDYPMPEGVTWPAWLRFPFNERGYKKNRDRAAANAAMRYLIDQFNLRLSRVAADHPGQVIHIPLTGTIEGHWKTDPLAGWANDLHPTDDAFALLAVKLDAVLQTLPRV